MKAKDLPDKVVPPEIIKLLPLDGLLDRIQIQKSATPVATPGTLEEAAANIDTMRPNGVVLEKSSHDEIDINAQRAAALETLMGQLNVEARRTERLEVKAGNEMLDQFQPWYFGVAFSFIFSYCTGMPDMPGFMRRPRYRRHDDAPRLEVPAWVKVMARRVEASVSRDWSFGFVTWNYLFRSAVNLSRTVYAYERKNANDESEQITAKLLEEGAIQIAKALWGKYKDPAGVTHNVGGDMTKVKWVAGLSPAAHRLLLPVECCVGRRRADLLGRTSPTTT